MRLLLASLFILSTLHADVLAILKGVRTDGIMRFSYKNHPFYCANALIETPAALLETSCRNTIQAFINAHPASMTMIETTLHSEQTYHLIPHNADCFVRLNGGQTVSEKLLEAGYAFLRPNEKHRVGAGEYLKLEHAQERAKHHKRGIWSDPSVVHCFTLGRL